MKLHVLILGDVTQDWPQKVMDAAVCQMDLDYYREHKCKHKPKCFDFLGKWMNSAKGKEMLKTAMGVHKKALA